MSPELNPCDDINDSYKDHFGSTDADHCQVARKNSKILTSLSLVNGNLDNSVLECVVFSGCRKYVFYC